MEQPFQSTWAFLVHIRPQNPDPLGVGRKEIVLVSGFLKEVVPVMVFVLVLAHLVDVLALVAFHQVAHLSTPYEFIVGQIVLNP
jgi:hypothetical protein